MHADIPTRADLRRLAAERSTPCATLYMPTTPVTIEAQGDRILFKNLSSQVDQQLEDGGAPSHERRAISDSLADLGADDHFWAHQANSLAVFTTPASIRTYRLANSLSEFAGVADRFDIKELLRAVTFPNACFVLALAQGSARLLEIAADVPPHDVRVPDLPADVASAAGKASIGGRSPTGRLQGSEGQKVRMAQYARQIETALRGVLAGRDLPLILAGAPPLDAIFRSIDSNPNLAEEGIRGNPEELSDAEISEGARAVLDRIYADDLDRTRSLFEERASQGRGVVELGDVARAATFGAIDTLFVDIDVRLRGSIDEQSGLVETDDSGVGDYGIADEIARRTMEHDGRILAVRAADIPGEGPVAAILRYPV